MSKVNLSQKVVEGLQNIQENWNGVFDCVYFVEEYIMNNESNKISAEDTLTALRKLRDIKNYITPLEQ